MDSVIRHGFNLPVCIERIAWISLLDIFREGQIPIQSFEGKLGATLVGIKDVIPQHLTGYSCVGMQIDILESIDVPRVIVELSQ